MGIVRSLHLITNCEESDKNFKKSPNLTTVDLESQSTIYFTLISSVLLLTMALVLFAAMSYQCAITWRWIKYKTCGDQPEEEATVLKQTAIQISHSLPDLQTEPLKEVYVQEIKEVKKVLRQTTLPIVPSRHQTFQRQLSNRLDTPSTIQFSICSLEHKSESSLVGLIKPELYKEELNRKASTSSMEPENMNKCGILYFSLMFDKEVEGLIVKIFEAKGLPIKDLTGSSDPYIKVFLLPDGKKKFQTKVQRKNLNPIFNETFIFSVSHEELRMRQVQFSVYDFDRFTRHDLIGHVVVKGLLENTDLQKEMHYQMHILCPKQEKFRLGELMLSLCYLPTAGRLTVTVIKAQNLKPMDLLGKSDPYVKVSLLCQGKRIKKKKTSIKKNTLSPVFNESLIFDIPFSNINDVSLIVKIIDFDRIGPNDLMGCIAIGSTFFGPGRDHWLHMLDNLRTPVTQWYTLTDVPPEYITETLSDKLPLGLSCLPKKKYKLIKEFRRKGEKIISTQFNY